MSNITVFGANGFIGRNLIKALSAVPGNKITAFDRFSAYQRNSSHPFDDYSKVEIVVGDFFNRSDVTRALSGTDYVFHLISATTPATSNSDPFIDIDTNLRSSVELFELCTQQGVKKVIYFSSGGTVYGDLDSPKISENTVPEPRSPYGINKLTIEHYLRYFKYTNQLDYIVYRVANPYGTGQNIHGKQGVIPIFMHNFLSGSPITIYGDGEMVRDYIYVEDLVTMVLKSYASNNHYSEYNIGNGKGISVNEIVSAVEKYSGKSVKKNFITTPPTFVQRSVLDISRFVEEFGIKPQTTLDEGINKTWNYVKELS